MRQSVEVDDEDIVPVYTTLVPSGNSRFSLRLTAVFF